MQTTQSTVHTEPQFESQVEGQIDPQMDLLGLERLEGGSETAGRPHSTSKLGKSTGSYGNYESSVQHQFDMPGETFNEVGLGTKRLAGLNNPAERNFQIAHQLAATLRGRGQYRRTYQALSVDQKKQFGQSICNHLKASLRQQLETADQHHSRAVDSSRAA